MKYIISNKDEKYLDFTTIKSTELDSIKNTATEIYVSPGTLESCESVETFIRDLKAACQKDCSVVFNFINIYQVFVDAAFHKMDIGIAHLVCRTIKNPFNAEAAHNFLKSSGFKIITVSTSEEGKFIVVECDNA